MFVEVILTVGPENQRTLKDKLKVYNPVNDQWKTLGIIPKSKNTYGYAAVMSGEE